MKKAVRFLWLLAKQLITPLPFPNVHFVVIVNSTTDVPARRLYDAGKNHDSFIRRLIRRTVSSSDVGYHLAMYKHEVI